MIAAARASASRMSAAANAAVMPSLRELAGEVVELRLRARHEADGDALAPEAPGDGERRGSGLLR